MIITKNIGSISLHTLRDNLTSVYLTDKEKVRNCLDDFINNRLKRLEKATRKLGEESIKSNFKK